MTWRDAPITSRQNIGMTDSNATAELLLKARVGDDAAWAELIGLYEGRLRAYFRPRVSDSNTADDLTQETFVAVWTSLPNFDTARPLEPFLFTIAAHKLTDWLRKRGRRPALPVGGQDDSSAGSTSVGPVSPGRAVSSMARSQEQRGREEAALAAVLKELVAQWQESAAWERLACVELTMVAGWANNRTADHLDLDEQSVANHKSYATRCIKEAVRKRGVLGRVSDIE